MPEKAPEIEGGSELEKKMREAIENAGSCVDNPGVKAFYAALVGAIEGREVVVPEGSEDDEDEDSYVYPLYSAVVPLEEKRAHNYPVGVPLVVAQKDDAGQAHGSLRLDGTGGNFLHGLWRYATDEEVETFFAALPADKTANILELFE